MSTQLATFGAGCFWNTEYFFRKVEGVQKATSGFMGGDKAAPSYEEVYTDTTGHAEVVQVEYDPERVSYNELLQVFWDNHNPTTLNRQGEDVGTRYRSVVFYHNEEQRQAAEQSKQAIAATPRFAEKTIVTEIVPASTFYAAEEYHQDYLNKNGLPACSIS